MTVKASTISVTTASILGLTISVFLSACHPGAAPTKQVTTGAASEAGRALVQKQWCTVTQQDPQNAHFLTEHYAFSATGELELQTTELQNDGSQIARPKSQRMWAISGDQLFIMNGQDTSRATLTKTPRASDQATCYTMVGDSTTQTLCPCL